MSRARSASWVFFLQVFVNVLAVVGAEGALDTGLAGLVDGAGLLGDELDALLAVSGDTNGLLVDETGVLVE